LDERYEIQRGLDNGLPFKAIARAIGRDCRTVAREVCARPTFLETGGRGMCFNDCANRGDCQVERLKPGCMSRRRCCFCFKCCRQSCGSYVRDSCEGLLKAPYSCNACKKRGGCTLTKAIYRAARADKVYRAGRSEGGKGICLDAGELARVDAIVSPLLKNGQSIHHVFIGHADELMISEKTLYSYISKGLLTAKNIDLPRVVRRKPRKCSHGTLKIDRRCRAGRSYEDMQRHMAEHGITHVAEMDSVIGRKGGKVLLTLFFTAFGLMLAFIRDANTARSVTEIFDKLYDTLGADTFSKLFRLVRTDNGSEFSDPAAIEFDGNGGRRSWVFYCEPYHSWQKPGCELNHEFIRRVLPKGSSFDGLTQEDVDLMMNHINSYARKDLNDKAPYDLFVAAYGKEVADRLGLLRIPHDEVRLTKALLKGGHQGQAPHGTPACAGTG